MQNKVIIGNRRTTGNFIPCYNGNISIIKWSYGKGSENGYTLNYDGMSRLKNVSSRMSPFNNSTSYSYDKHGNVLNIRRSGLINAKEYGMVDDITLSYNGNQLLRADDRASSILLSSSLDFKDYSKNVATEYTYDCNGNMLSDLNRGITNTGYNFLNLPEFIDISSPVAEVRSNYFYSGSGEKLRVEQTSLKESKLLPVTMTDRLVVSIPVTTARDVSTTDSRIVLAQNGIRTVATKDLTTTDYCNNVIYEGKGSVYGLRRILTDNGYIENDIYYFYIKDHQGNNRLVLDESGNIVQKTDYYPFGTLFQKSEKCDQPYLYGGKEFETDGGLNSYDFGARTYDPAICRFGQVDPLCEDYYGVSPYVYCLNNPIKFVDRDGREVRLADNVSKQFRKDFNMAIRHLNRHDAGEIYKELQISENVYTIMESNNSRFNTLTNTVEWNSRMGILTNNAIMLSPTSVLNHEFDHALQHDKNPMQQIKDSPIDDKNPYRNNEEKRVITGSEQKTARKLGEIRDGEVTRKDHNGAVYEVKSSISTEIKNPIIIIPKKDEKNSPY
jgi:RHS repeat-associated protein